MRYIPDRGDIILLDFDPSSGEEIMKRRPALVLSRKVFNAHTNFVVVAPITSKVKGIKLEVVLPENISVQGAILMHQFKSLDYRKRNARFVEKASKEVVDQASTLARLIIS